MSVEFEDIPKEILQRVIDELAYDLHPLCLSKSNMQLETLKNIAKAHPRFGHILYDSDTLWKNINTNLTRRTKQLAEHIGDKIKILWLSGEGCVELSTARILKHMNNLKKLTLHRVPFSKNTKLPESLKSIYLFDTDDRWFKKILHCKDIETIEIYKETENPNIHTLTECANKLENLKKLTVVGLCDWDAMWLQDSLKKHIDLRMSVRADEIELDVINGLEQQNMRLIYKKSDNDTLVVLVIPPLVQNQTHFVDCVRGYQMTAIVLCPFIPDAVNILDIQLTSGTFILGFQDLFHRNRNVSIVADQIISEKMFEVILPIGPWILKMSAKTVPLYFMNKMQIMGATVFIDTASNFDSNVVIGSHDEVLKYVNKRTWRLF
jgi:hypothetical protein